MFADQCSSALRLKSQVEIPLDKAIDVQEKIAKLVIEQSHLPRRLKRICGLDVAYSNDSAVAAAVTLDYATLEPVERRTVLAKVRYPYVPTFLGFREFPTMAKAYRVLRKKPDVCLIDGHGIAHPRRCGSACHFGVMLNVPTIGVAKSRLYGTIDGGFLRNGEGKILGSVITSGKRKKPIYISIGHKVSLKDATEIVLHCMRFGIPEPLRLAHLEANSKRSWRQE